MWGWLALKEIQCPPFLTGVSLVPHQWKVLWVQFSSLSCVRLFVTPGTAACQASLSNANSHQNSCPLRRWCHPTISSSVVPFSSCSQSLQVSGSFPTSQLFASGSQSIGASASASVFPMKIQGWFPLELTDLVSLLSKEHSRVFPSTISTFQNLFPSWFQIFYFQTNLRSAE